MSWDPNQPQGQPPSGPNPYDPQQQYMPPPQNPYEQPASGPNVYSQPMGGPGAPYNTPPINPYSQPPGAGAFGSPGYQTNTAYGYAPSAPLPLGVALQQLPNQYIKVTTKPGVQPFAEEQNKADWGIIWVQLLILGLLGTVIGLLRAAMSTAVLAGLGEGGFATSYALFSSALLGGTSVYSIISIILGFFIIVGIQYLLARAFGGNGDFKQQGYNYLLFNVPITIVSYIVGLIPILGGVVAFVLWLYGLVLNVFAIQASHRLSGGKATAVVLIPIAALIVLFLLCAVVIAALFAAAIHGAATP